MKWMFLDGARVDCLSEEFKAQIFPLNKEASSYLWNAEAYFKIFGQAFFEEAFFQDNERYSIVGKSEKEVKKWLFQRGIPFSQRVFVAIQPAIGFVLIWKMVIKFWDGLFVNDQAVWDRTLNWGLVYDHNQVFYFGKNRLYNSDKEAEKIYEHQRIIQEIQQQIELNQLKSVKKLFPNPYLK